VLAVFVLSEVTGIDAATYRIAERLEIDKVPSWFPVGFCLLTAGEFQYVSYYNEQHQMMVARRPIMERQWQRVALPSKIGWDSHNYVTMAMDEAGDIHLSGNMHCVPLIYFRTQQPGDITTFQPLTMTGHEEQRCTYPRFLRDLEGNLLFTYRSGGSGNGRRFYNTYDVAGRTWNRFINSPLFEGQGKRNAYPLGPTQGPDGLFHLVWVWRETPDCATNHHLSYCRSRDLKNWETAGGTPVTLPLTLEQTELCVDPVPVGGGIINGCERLAFDSNKRPMISYHKSDENGHMQIYVARFEGDEWRSHRITRWKKNIPFGGGGAMPFIGIGISGLKLLESGMLYIEFKHRDYGSGKIILDESTLQPTERDAAIPVEYPPGLTRPSMNFSGIRVKLAQDVNASAESDSKFVLRWQTLGANYDRPRKPPLPPASTLELVKLVKERNGGVVE